VHTIDGGPTLNPSTYDLLAGIHEVPAGRSSSSQQRECDHGGRARRTLVGQAGARRGDDQPAGGLAAAVALAPGRSVEENSRALSDALAHIPHGLLAPAARDDAQGRFSTGDAVGFVEDELIAWGEPRETLAPSCGPSSDPGEESGAPELLSILSGDGAPLSLAELEGIVDPSIELELRHGGSRRTGGCSQPSEVPPPARAPRALRPPP